MYKFKIGQLVRVKHPTAGEWTGRVTRRADAGEGLEYWVENAPACLPGLVARDLPLLAWESEMEACDVQE